MEKEPIKKDYLPSIQIFTVDREEENSESWRIPHDGKLHESGMSRPRII